MASGENLVLWSRAEENCLINFYRKHPSLWKTDDKDYNNRMERKKLYFKLANELSLLGRKCSIKDITNKYRNLKSIYYRELKKVNETFKQSSELEGVRPYIPRWEHFSKLRFLPMYPNSSEYLGMSANNSDTQPDVQCTVEIKEEMFEEYHERDVCHQENSSLSEASENDHIHIPDEAFQQDLSIADTFSMESGSAVGPSAENEAPVSKGSASHTAKRKHRTLSIKDKIELLEKLDSGVPVNVLCKYYNIGTSTVYEIKKSKRKLLSFFAESSSKKHMCFRKTMKNGRSSELDKVMIRWFNVRASEGAAPSGDMVKEQARVFHEALGLDYECSYGEGWLYRFKQRHGLHCRTTGGEKRSADKEARTAFVDEFAKLVSGERLSPQQVYNADETALYWRCTPSGMLTMADAEWPSGLKASKDRVTLLGCANAAGTHRCKLVVVGKTLRPRALKGMRRFPVIYRANRKGLITTDITLEWFENYFVPEARAHCDSVGLDRNCKIMLILDNCSAHPKAELMIKDNVFVTHLPPNCPSSIQPLENGILRSLKSKYRFQFMRHLLSEVNAGRPVVEFMKDFNVKEMIYCAANAWQSVEVWTLKNAWHKLWPGLMFVSAPGSDSRASRVPKEKEMIRGLLDFAEELTNPAAEDLSSRLDDDDVEEWLNVDEDVSIVHHYTDLEMAQMVINPENGDSGGESSDEVEEGESEEFSVDRLIELTVELQKGLEQGSSASDRDILSVYRLRQKLIAERQTCTEHLTFQDVFRNIARQRAKDERAQDVADDPDYPALADM